MITYKRCTEASTKDIIDAFNIGFSDYIIKLQLNEELFYSRFIKVEQNQLENSFIAYDDQLPIGLILGGIKSYEGIKTLRCGTLCIHPDYRKQGVASELFKLHKQQAIDAQCERLYLEVIQGNDKAINFYLKQGYQIMNNLLYYSHQNPNEIKSIIHTNQPNRRIDIETVQNLHLQKVKSHLHWQNDFDYMGYFDNLVNYGLYHKKQLIGALSILPSGKIFYLWIDKDFRRNGLARRLLSFVVHELKLTKLSISFPESTELTYRLEKLGFTKDFISQYDMNLDLN